MLFDPVNASELASIAREIGADVLEAVLRYPSDTGGWQLGDLDLSEYLDLYRGKRLALIIAPVGKTEPQTYTCGICGFVMSDVRACPRCQLVADEAGGELDGDALAAPDILDQVDELLGGMDIQKGDGDEQQTGGT